MTEYTFIKRSLQNLKNSAPFKVLKRIDKGNEPFFIVLSNDEGFKMAMCRLEYRPAKIEGFGYLIERETDYLKIQDTVVMAAAGDMSPGLEIFKDRNLQEYSCTISSPFGKEVTELLSESVRIVGLTIDELFEAIATKKEVKLTATKSISNLYGTEEIVCEAKIV